MKKENSYLLILIILISFMIVSTYASTKKGIEPTNSECPPGMVSYWKFDEGDGNIIHDFINNNDGTIYGASWVSGRVGVALSFDGVNDRVSIPPHTISGTTVTLCLWVKTNDTEFALISGANRQFDNEYVLYFHRDHGSKLELYFHDNMGWYGDGFYPTNITINDNLWHMITVVTEVNGTQIYVDGSLAEITDPPYGSVSSFNVKGLWIGAEQDCVNGCWSTSQQFNGLIDEVAIYNRALQRKEIEQHYYWGLEGIGYFGPSDTPTTTTPTTTTPTTPTTPTIPEFDSWGLLLALVCLVVLARGKSKQ